MTEDQKKYYNAMKKLGSKAPQKPIPKPKVSKRNTKISKSQVSTEQTPWETPDPYLVNLSSESYI